MEKTAEYCDKALEIDETHVKSIFRKGQALVQLKDFDGAFHCFETAHGIDPTNNSIRNELQRLKEVIKRKTEKSGRSLAKGLSKMTQGGLYGDEN